MVDRLSFQELRERIEVRRDSGGNFQDYLVDILRSYIRTTEPAYAGMTIETEQTISVPETPIVMNVWDENPIAGLYPDLTPNLTSGLVTAAIPCVIDMTVNYQMEFATNEDHVATLSKTGTPPLGTWGDTARGEGNGRPSSISFVALFVVAAGEQFGVDINTQSGSTDVTFQKGSLVARYVPLANTPA